MPVKTDLSPDDLSAMLALYDLGGYVAAQPFPNGAVHTNLRLDTTKGPYVLRYYEKRSPEWIAFESSLISFLRARDYPTPRPIPDKNCDIVAYYDGKPYTIFDFAAGTHGENPNDSPYDFRYDETARVIARLHGLTAGYEPVFAEHREGRDKEDAWATAQETAKKIVDPALRAERLSWYRAELDKIALPAGLPRGVCHADVNYGNFLFDDERVSAVLDFDMACCTYLVYDLANLIYWWAWPPEKGLNFETARRIVKAYEAVRPLDESEKAHLYNALKMVFMMDVAWFIDDANGDMGESRQGLDFLTAMGRETFVEKVSGV